MIRFATNPPLCSSAGSPCKKLMCLAFLGALISVNCWLSFNRSVAIWTWACKWGWLSGYILSNIPSVNLSVDWIILQPFDQFWESLSLAGYRLTFAFSWRDSCLASWASWIKACVTSFHCCWAICRLNDSMNVLAIIVIKKAQIRTSMRVKPVEPRWSLPPSQLLPMKSFNFFGFIFWWGVRGVNSNRAL